MPNKLTGDIRVFFYSYVTLAVGRGGWSMLHPGCLTPGKETWYPLV